MCVSAKVLLKSLIVWININFQKCFKIYCEKHKII